MFTLSVPLILASTSPRRQQFLRELGLSFAIQPAAVDETPRPGEPADDFIRRMAMDKAAAVSADHPEACVLGADTVVLLDDTIFGKPENPEQALAMLRRLQGRTHRVGSAFALLCPAQGIRESRTVHTAVTFGSFPDTVLQAYVDSGEPLDKAGAYGIQGQGGFLVRSIDGSYSNVVGLPINEVVQSLLHHALITPAPPAVHPWRE
ncbi:MAG: Maf family protein [Desulfobulbus sp.]|jgi:septum formation protein